MTTIQNYQTYKLNKKHKDEYTLPQYISILLFIQKKKLLNKNLELTPLGQKIMTNLINQNNCLKNDKIFQTLDFINQYNIKYGKYYQYKTLTLENVFKKPDKNVLMKFKIKHMLYCAMKKYGASICY